MEVAFSGGTEYIFTRLRRRLDDVLRGSLGALQTFPALFMISFGAQVDGIIGLSDLSSIVGFSINHQQF